MEQSVLLFSGFLLGVSLAATVGAYVTCLSCLDVTSPSNCRQSMTCGEGEICYTREFKDNRGLQGFRLGCEDGARCTLFFNAEQLLGKRAIASPDKCYECCSGDGCNAHLCQGKGTNVPQTPNTSTWPTCNCPAVTTVPCTRPSCPQTTCPTAVTGTGCPPLYTSHIDRCYFVANWTVRWDDGRAYCKNHGGDLVSINSKDEQDFLVQMLNNINDNTFNSIWTGGSYVSASHEWKWVDGSRVGYAIWWPGEPGSFPLDHDNYMYISNPSYANMTYYKEGRWGAAEKFSSPFLCEKQKV